MPSKGTLTQARLKELLHYDPETGRFTRRVSRGGYAVGSRAGTTTGRGYLILCVDRKCYLAHRLAFLYMTGSWPPAEVDHINRDPSDNRWENLRLATRQENSWNIGLRGDNTSGHRGVSWDKENEKWQARGARDGRRVHLGRFESLEEAAAATRKWREDNFGEFAVEA